MELEKHYVTRVGWLRATVLGANDGILSTSSIIVGVAAASESLEAVVLAALAGSIAGAMSMAAGEYVSVSSQADVEKADLAREKKELEEIPEAELVELAKIYEARGLDKTLSMRVAVQLTEHNALEAHARDELGINEIMKAKPLQAAFASFVAFTIGAAFPFIVALIAPIENMVFIQYISSISFLMLLGAVAAKSGGSSWLKAVMRICFWGTIAMAMTALVGYLFGIQVG